MNVWIIGIMHNKKIKKSYWVTWTVYNLPDLTQTVSFDVFVIIWKKLLIN
jgi:hypothetical protein